MAKAIGTLGTVDTLSVGGYTFTDFTNIKVLHAFLATDTRQSTFRAEGATSGYAVTAAKTLTIKAIFQNSLSGNASKIRYGYADNDVGFDSATALTNPIHLAASTDIGFLNPVAGGLTGDYHVNQFINPNFPIPAGKFMFAHEDVTGSMQLISYGYEV